MDKPFVFSEFRKSLGLTQKEFADKCGTTIRSVQNWEQGATVTPQAMRLFQYIEAEMLSKTSAVAQDHSIAISGSGCGNHMNSELASVTEKFIEEIAAHRRLVEKSQEQIDRLVSLLEHRDSVSDSK